MTATTPSRFRRDTPLPPPLFTPPAPFLMTLDATMLFRFDAAIRPQIIFAGAAMRAIAARAGAALPRRLPAARGALRDQERSVIAAAMLLSAMRDLLIR